MSIKLVVFLFAIEALATAAAPQPVTFFQTAAIGMTAPPEDVAIADVNGDGIPDLISANNSVSGSSPVGGTISVMLGKGAGKFGAPMTQTIGPAGVVSLLVADFTGNGIPDLVVSDADANVYFLNGNGNGTFGAPVSIPGNFAVAPRMLLTADFNGDGIPDLAIPTAITPTDAASGVAILLGNGNGTFTAASELTINVVAPFAVADFNGDGIPDLAIPAEPNNGVPNAVAIVQIYLGNGNGTFLTGTDVELYSPMTAGGVAAADFNGDGNNDIAVSYTDSSLNTTKFAIYDGNGNGTFGSGTAIPCDLGPQAPIIADFNGDGKPDIALPSALGDTVAVYLNLGGGSFSIDYYIVGGSAVAVAAGDLYQSDDGVPDLAVANLSGSSIATLQNMESGTFYGPVSASRVGNSLATADFNGDGNLDVATSGGDVLLGNGKGQYTVSPVIVAYPQGSVLAADINGDGIPDLTTGFLNVSVALGLGDGAFSPPVISVLPSQISGMVSGDFNGNGKVDLLVTSTSTGLSLLEGNGNGTFQQAQTVAPGNFIGVVAADFNGDGNLDAAAIKFNATVNAYQVLLYLGEGTGKFQAPVTLKAEIDAASLLAMDVNNDGKIDLIVGGTTTGASPTAVAVLFGNGNGTFHNPAIYATSVAQGVPAVVALTAGNFNGSGRIDIAAATASSLIILLNEGSSTFTIQSQRFPVDGAVSLGSGQLKPDILPAVIVGNATSESVWTMRNTTP
jgi:hypothetical protein